MRVTVNIDDNLMKDVMEFTKAKSNSQAVIIALQDLVRSQKIQELKSLRGKLKIDIDLKALRNQDLKEF